MLAHAVKSYLSVRQAAGFQLAMVRFHLRSFASYADARGEHYVRAGTAIEWARQVPSVRQRARRLADVIRFARYMLSEDARHEVPSAIFGSEKGPRPPPYILSEEQVRELIELTARSNYRKMYGETYSTLFALLSCTGLRISEAIRLRYDDITPDGLVIRTSKYRKSRLVPLHPSARDGLEKYLQLRRPYAPLDDHVFVSWPQRPIGRKGVQRAFQLAVKKMGLPTGRGKRRPTPHSLRHGFAVRALQTCPDSRDQITQHTLMLSTALGHSNAAYTYWYLEAVPELMRSISDRCEAYVGGDTP
jgi:integrase